MYLCSAMPHVPKIPKIDYVYMQKMYFLNDQKYNYERVSFYLRQLV